jgi:hypothetical protein
MSPRTSYLGVSYTPQLRICQRTRCTLVPFDAYGILVLGRLLRPSGPKRTAVWTAVVLQVVARQWLRSWWRKTKAS